MAYQHELKGLPELQFNLQVEGDDVWLRLPRLQEIAAPEPDEILRPWVTLPKSPEKTAELKGEIIILESKREVARERIEDHPEVRELFDWYVEYHWEPWAAAERPRRKTIARYNQLCQHRTTFPQFRRSKFPHPVAVPVLSRTLMQQPPFAVGQGRA